MSQTHIPAGGELEIRNAMPHREATFSSQEIEGLPGPARRYLTAAIASGTPLTPSVLLSMSGSIRLGKRWFPFRSREVLAPHLGFEWSARVAGVISGSDRYANGDGSMRWKLLGLIPIMTADGPDVSRSDIGRIAGEAPWVPIALLPRFGVSWEAASDDRITASYALDGRDVALEVELDLESHVRSVRLPRWGDPDGSGTFGLHPFGMEVTESGDFGGLTIPCVGRAGWFYGTDRWQEGEFFRYEIGSVELADPEGLLRLTSA